MSNKLKIEIKNRFTGSVLFEYEKEDNTVRDTVIAAVESDADLSDADLSGADLRDANLSGADLRDANLSGANLSGADLRDANLSGANLSGADLRDANLRGANLSGANLRDANLSGANLRDANLSGANLSGANLRDANLSGADLSGANLSGADLRGADLRDANLSDANLSDATIAYSDSDLDEQSVAKDFAANAQLDSLETEMRHGIKSARNWWAFRWKNVVKIKSWKLKDGSATSGQNPDNSTPESGDLSGQKTQSEKQEEQKFAIAVAAAGIRHQDMLALKKAAEDIPLLDGAKLTITYRNI